MQRSLQFALRIMLLSTAAMALSVSPAAADDADSEQFTAANPVGDGTKEATVTTKPAAAPATSATATKPTPKPTAPAHVALLKDSKSHAGLMTLYQKDDHLYAELSSSHYNTDFIVLISIARGVGQGVIMPGMTWKGEDDWVWQFRKVGKRVMVVRRNLRFRAKTGSPQAEAVDNAYTDSVLYSLPIVTKGPKGGDLVDLSLVFMTDLPQISQLVKGFSFSKTRSTWSAVKTFTDNVELQVAATYASSGMRDFVAVPDSRGMTINVHYSISRLPKTGYRPRLADERIGYFITAVMDYSKKTHHDRFVRYINRWDLRKADATAKTSPPKKPIVFWIENTVPFQFRKPIREGILEWNKAFEKAGFLDAVEVRQQPEKADWDPEDINYNTIRWITAGEGIAYGPSRVNPTTGEILDADILIDADFMQYVQELYDAYTDGNKAAAGLFPSDDFDRPGANGTGRLRIPFGAHGHLNSACQLHQGLARDYALGAAAMARSADPAELEKLVMQGLKSAVMHEVGHTLGLRHNFKASTNVSIEDLSKPVSERKHGTVASVMDYIPAFLATKDSKQDEYYPTTIGAYDHWAIQYGYKPVSGGSTDGERAELNKIAARSGEVGHAYGSDEDTRSGDPDPLSQRFDLGSDPIEFANYRAKLVGELLPDLVDRVVNEGDNYYQARRAFGILLATRGTAMQMAARNIGGAHVSRSHKGDADAPAPFAVVDVKQQRASIEILEKELFGDKPFDFPPELYNHLATPRWIHWGSSLSDRVDYPVHRVILSWQEYVLSHLLSSTTLGRLSDSELKVSRDNDAFTTAELIQRLTRSIYSELEAIKKEDYTNRKPAISSIRRNLQRAYLKRISAIAMGNTAAPADCQTIAAEELSALEDRIRKVLANKAIKLDDYTRAHLKQTADRIRKVLDADLQLRQP